MSELKRESESREQEYSDVVPDEEEIPSPYEKTYPDGSAAHECWAGDGRD